MAPYRKGALMAVAVMVVTAATADGMTLDAFQAAARARIMRGDADGDGKISKAEWVAAMPGGGEMKRDPARIFDVMDTNKDGFLDASEIDALTARRFARMDANHDGILTADERKAGRRGAAD